MSFHPQQCQVIHITTKHNIVKHPYNIHGHNLPETDTAKYLGVHLHKTLNWTTHIDKTAHKANYIITRAFLHQNIRTCNQKTKQIAYTTLIRPILEYASTVWDPHAATNTHKLEMVQRRSARLVMHNFDPRSDLARNIDNKIQTVVILLDFQKAFDKVPNQRLLYKINHYGRTGQTHLSGTGHLTIDANSYLWCAIIYSQP